jgi:uncharacterized membrane protein
VCWCVRVSVGVCELCVCVSWCECVSWCVCVCVCVRVCVKTDVSGVFLCVCTFIISVTSCCSIVVYFQRTEQRNYKHIQLPRKFW